MKLRSHRLSQLHEHYFAGLEKQIEKLKSAGKEIYRLDVGSPDLPPAPHIIDAIQRTVDEPDHHGYQPLAGAKSVRQAWADHYQDYYRVSIDPDREVIPLIGSKEGIFLMSQAILDPGDIVLVPDPSYLVYEQSARFALAEPYFFPLTLKNSWLPDLNAIPREILEKARILWLNYPNNPTGAAATFELFSIAVALARKYDILLCHDAAYSLVTFDQQKPMSLLQISGASEVAVEFNTLSKAYNMAGWRIGAALGNAEALHSLFSLMTTMNSGSFRPANEAAIVALTGEQSWVIDRNLVYQHRRDLVLQALHQLGWEASLPSGGLYVWFRTPEPYPSSQAFCLDLLGQTGVSLTPGSVFGSGGEGYVRLSFTICEDDLQEALRRLYQFLPNVNVQDHS
jgi:LL-diaminopimelate aminotransferase